jgi:hypothetical protein
MRRGLLMLVLLVFAPGVLFVGSSAATTAATTFSYTGSEQTYTVPAGATAVTVTAVGAPGGAFSALNPGGKGAAVTATVPLPAGTTTLYVEVGGAGGAASDGFCADHPPAAFNGGGGFAYSYWCGGGGGGASDVRTTSLATIPNSALTSTNDSRLVVAGGGGGGDSDPLCPTTTGPGGTAGDTSVTGAGAGGTARGGTASSPDCGDTSGGNGGLGGTQGGAGGVPSGGAGALGQGGSAADLNDGSGGGGYWGGGGGGADTVAAGGGAGSSFWITGATATSMTEDTTGTPSISITPVFPTCTATGYYRDGINLTAKVMNPSSTVTGSVDATGCNIGVYYGPGTSGTVSGADISGANYYGVVNNAGSVSISNSSIHNIGETQPNGSQHGVGVIYTTLNGSASCNACVTSGPHATGTLSGSLITNYQKNGVVISGSGAAATVRSNTVTGYGMIDYIAQNGIEVASRATASIMGNTVSGNWYTPSAYVACGLLFYQAGGVKQSSNNLFNNEVNLCNAGRGGGHYKP